MSIRRIVRPVYALTCDADGCAAELRDNLEYGVKHVARLDGWQLRPGRGKGSRTAPDFCPEHHTEPAEGGTR